MAQFPYFLAILFFLAAVWFAWRYFDLKRRLDSYAQTIRKQGEMPELSGELEGISAAMNILQTAFHSEQLALNAGNARLATVLAQLTDGVLIADAEGRVQLANPAAGKLFGVNNPTQQTVAQVVRNHQLIEAWKRCQKTRQVEIEAVELPARKLMLQVTMIPDQHEGGSLLLVQDMTQVRKLEIVRRDFI